MGVKGWGTHSKRFFDDITSVENTHWKADIFASMMELFVKIVSQGLTVVPKRSSITVFDKVLYTPLLSFNLPLLQKNNKLLGFLNAEKDVLIIMLTKIIISSKRYFDLFVENGQNAKAYFIFCVANIIYCRYRNKLL